MTTERLAELFDAENDEYIKFDRVRDHRSARPDLHAFLLLNQLQPGNDDIVSGAGHEEIYLSIDTGKLAEVISEDQIVELLRCGVRYDTEYECLAMFV